MTVFASKSAVVAALWCLFFSVSAIHAYAPNPVIQTAAQGMNLLRPIFKAQAGIQATLLGSEEDQEAAVAQLQADKKKKNQALIYTYGWSPFSSEAVQLLESTGYDFVQKELGAEWFLLGGQESALRVELAKEVESGATSLPKVFIGGTCIGGCREVGQLAQSGDLETLLRKARVPKKKTTTAKKTK